MQHAVLDLLRAALIPELGADIATGAAGNVQLVLVAVAALGALPHQLAVILHDLDLAVIAAHLTVIRLGVQLRIHDVVIDELQHTYDGFQIVLHVGHFHIADGTARRQALEVALELQLGEGIDLFRHMHMVAVGDIVLVGNAGHDAKALLQALGELVGGGFQRLSREDAIAILNTPDEELDHLIAQAEKLRRKYKGNHVSIHILTNARSGNCSQDCAYCAQSCRSKADIDKYKWVADEKLYKDNDFVNEHHLSRHCIGLSGMKFTDEEIEELASKIRKMKEDGTHLCCSIGFLTEKQALMLKEAGLDRINHNLNSSRAYYSHICSTHTFEQRVQNIKMLQRLGFEICSGGIIGMGESKEDVVDMLLELREIQPEALPINFLLPIPGTPLGDADISELTTEYCMKVLCLARLLVPQSDIRCAAGREVYFKGEEKKLLSVVDSIFASGYLTADGQGIKDTIRTITDAGFTYEIESA